MDHVEEKSHHQGLKFMKKAALRTQFLAQRMALTEAEITAKSQRISDWLCQSLPMQSWAYLHSFLPIKTKNEIDTWLIINRMNRDFPFCKIVVPKILSDGQLAHYQLNKSHLIANKWGVLEPDSSKDTPIDCSKIDLVLVPLLAFDKAGNRVGYGKGFYDEFLKHCRPDCLKVGLSFFEPVDAIEGVSATDMPLDYCVTPNRIWTFSR